MTNVGIRMRMPSSPPLPGRSPPGFGWAERRGLLGWAAAEWRCRGESELPMTGRRREQKGLCGSPMGWLGLGHKEL